MPKANTLNRWSHEEVTVYICWCLTKINSLTVLLLSFKVVWDLNFLTYDLLCELLWCLTKINTLIVLPLSFHIVCDLTFFDLWPLNHRSGEEVTVVTFWCFAIWDCLNLTPFFDLSDLKWPQVKFIVIILKENVNYFMCMNDMIIMNNIEELKHFLWKWIFGPCDP